MSIVVPSHTYVHSIPIQRRIREIMNDKGGAFTISALSTRIGINRETFRKMLTGEREIYTFELEKIAKEMNLTVARILQEDLRDIAIELDALIAKPTDLARARELAEKFLSIAVGLTERCEAYILIGRVHFEMQEYEQSHQHRLEAYSLATISRDLYGETKQLDTTIRNLLTSFTVRKDYANACLMMDSARENVGNDPHRLGEISYTLAMIAYSAGRLVEAKGHLLESLQSYQESTDQKEIGKALHNVAFIEYKLKHYESARELFEQCIETLEDYPKNRLIAVKDYVKVLHVLGRNADALRLIEEGLQEPCLCQIPDLGGKLRLLYAIYTESVNEALSVLESSEVSDNLKLISCKVLMDYYTRQGESGLLMKYYIIAQQYTLCEFDKYGEGDL